MRYFLGLANKGDILFSSLILIKNLDILLVLVRRLCNLPNNVQTNTYTLLSTVSSNLTN